MGRSTVTPLKPTSEPQEGLPDNATHHQLVEDWVATYRWERPVACEDAFFICDPTTQMWERRPLGRVAQEFAASYPYQNQCRSRPHYQQLAKHAYDYLQDDTFFDDLRPGIRTPSAYYAVDGGQVSELEPSPDQRQRYALDIDPDPWEMPLFDEYLTRTFANENPKIRQQQIDLFQEIFGAVVTGIMARHEKAALFYGQGATGKSTALRLIQACIPPEQVAAVSPVLWGNEYFRATLAGKKLNIVGESEPGKTLPAEFKGMLGRDRQMGRFPHGRPFSFMPSAAHVFAANHFIPTHDHSSGFWRRWLLLGFDNVVPEQDRNPDLDRKLIEDELPTILHWALQGAARVLAGDGFSHSTRNDQLIARWQLSTDAVAEFLADSDVVSVEDGAEAARAAIYKRFIAWTQEVGRKPVGRSEFYERLEQQGHRLKKVHGIRLVEGLRLL